MEKEHDIISSEHFLQHIVDKSVELQLLLKDLYNCETQKIYKFVTPLLFSTYGFATALLLITQPSEGNTTLILADGLMITAVSFLVAKQVIREDSFLNKILNNSSLYKKHIFIKKKINEFKKQTYGLDKKENQLMAYAYLKQQQANSTELQVPAYDFYLATFFQALIDKDYFKAMQYFGYFQSLEETTNNSHTISFPNQKNQPFEFVFTKK
jgi:hypothetical protein